jgi:hypothetical protein
MDTAETALAVGFGAAALVLLVLQQLFFVLAVTTLLREGRAEIAQAFDVLRTLNTRLEKLETEARLRRVDRRCDTGGPRATNADRVAPRDSEERCRRVSTINDDRSTPTVVHDIDCDPWAWLEPEGGRRSPSLAHSKKPSIPSSAADAPCAAARSSASATAPLHRRPAQASPFIKKTLSAGDAEAPRSVFDRPNMRVSSGGRLQGRSSSQSSSRDGLEGAQASTAPPTAKTRRHASPVEWPRGFPTKIRSGTGPVSSGSLFYANVVAKMRREN